MSTHIIGTGTGKIAESVLLPGDPLRAKYIAENFLNDPVCYSKVRNIYGYTGTYMGVPVSVQGTGMGMPSMGIYSWELITEYHAKNLIRIGTAGSFNKDIKMGDIVLALSASTDSNYAHTFELPGTYSPCASWNLIKKAYEISKESKIEIKAGNVVSCDVFYEIPENWWKKWADVGILAVEMEAAALYMNAAYKDVNALAMMSITDHFITGEKATTKERTQSGDDIINLALKVATT